MKNRKSTRNGILTAIIILTAAIALALCACAGAEGAGKRGLTLSRPVPQRTRRANPWLGATETVTCAETEWTLEEDVAATGTEYTYSIGILDGTNPPNEDGAQIADIFYAGAATESASFRYTFYEPGSYVLFIDISGENGTAAYYYEVTVTEGEGENPLMNEAQRIAAICRGESEFDTAAAIDEYLCARVEYDYSYTYYSAQDALLAGKGTCSAYTRAFELIGKQCGLQVYRVCDNENQHTWNAVRMDGNWYHIDTTWDDAGDRSDHRYFGLTDALISTDHIIEYYAQGKSCVCDRMECNYFVHENMLEKLLCGSQRNQTYPQIIQTRFDEGGTVYDEPADRDMYLIDESRLTGLFYDFPWPMMREILTAGLPKHVFTAQGEAVSTTVETTEDERLRVAITGWAAEESGRIETPADLEAIEAGAFEGTDATTVILTEKCREIGSRAFAKSAVRTIRIPGSVETIEEDAFDECGRILIIAEEGTKAAEFAAEKGYLRIEP